MGFVGGLVGGTGDDTAAVLEVRGEHAVGSGEMGAGAWYESGEAGDEVNGVEHDMSRPVTEGVLQSIHDLPAVIDREAFVRDGRASDVATEAFEGVPVTGSAARAGRGFRRAIDSYSAFYENDRSISTGLATDFCVAYSAIDGARESFEAAVIKDACRGIDLNGSLDAAWEQMPAARVARANLRDI